MTAFTLFSRLRRPDPDNTDKIRQAVIERLQKIQDPELNINIYDLGLVYEVLVKHQGMVQIKMTLTAPACPVAQTFPQQVEKAVQQLAAVTDCRVKLIWEPPWDKSRISDAGKLQLGIF